MPILIFDIKGSLKLDGVLITSGKQVEVELDGQLITGGCVDASIARAIGVNNLVTALDHDEVLSQYSVDDFIDHIINSNRSDSEIKHISKQLDKSLQTL